MILFTIGSGQKSAEKFFSLLKQNRVQRLIDIRLNNKSQLAGFTKSPDLQYFLKQIAAIDYIHLPILAPTQALLAGYREKKMGSSRNRTSVRQEKYHEENYLETSAGRG